MEYFYAEASILFLKTNTIIYDGCKFILERAAEIISQSNIAEKICTE